VGLKINIGKTNIVVFKKGGKLSRDDKWWLDGEGVEIVKEIKYLEHRSKSVRADI
jgi:hypothetical protein